MPLNDYDKQTLTRYKKYIEKGNYDTFFGNIREGDRCRFAEFLYLDAGINFLTKLSSIPSYLFKDSERLTSIVIPKNIKTLGNNAFENCKALEEVDIESGPVSIGTEAFARCNSLKVVNIEPGVKSIAPRAFALNTSLKKIILPETTDDLGQDAFGGCDNIIIVTEFRPAGSTNRLKVKQSDIPFYKQHLKFTHKNAKKEQPDE